ncbi:MAG: transglutaminase domain-containing protein [Acidobacteriota bacterium]|nr:transglutaminase domain-containing protein [Acidobacteriota bacterium]
MTAVTAPERPGIGRAAPPPSGWALPRRDRRPAGPTSPGSARPAATAALSVVTVASACALFRVFSSERWVGPVGITVVVVHAVCWGLRRVRAGHLAAAMAVAATTALLVTWTLFGGYTTLGVPTGRVWHQVTVAFGQISGQFASTQPPVPPTRALELLAVLGAAGAAALADWSAFRWRSPLLAVTPGVAVFVFSAAAGVGPGRALTIGVEVAAICGFLVVERATAEGRVWFAGVKARVGAWTAGFGAVAVATSVVAATALSPALAPRDGVAVLGWRNGFGQGGGTRIVQNPLVDLRTRLIQYANVPVFVVSSTAPSYWRLTALDQFDGVLWQAQGSYGGFGARLPGSPPAGAAVRTVRATFEVQQLDSDWLPAQFDPIAVQGLKGVTYDQNTESLLTATATSPHLQYSVTSYERLDTLSAAALNSAPPLTHDSTVTTNLELPSAIDPRIAALAETLTANAATEYQKALAIQNYLLGPSFTYSLDPPSDGTGVQAVANFLFETRTGYCQQFAGAFAVLARAAGLPTRLAVGFTQGTPAGGGSFQIYDRDAHTWPEVYFGAQYGWVPFEPTKGFTIPGTTGYNKAPSGSPTGSSSPTTTVPVSPAPTTPSNAARTHTSLGPKSLPTSSPSVAVTHRAANLSGWLLVVPAAVVVWLAANGALPRLLRRRRRRVAARAGAASEVLNSWQEVTSELGWFGLERRRDETHDEFARRVEGALLRYGSPRNWQHGGMGALAAMTRRAAFAADVPADLGAQARSAAAEVASYLADLSGPAQRLSRWWRPSPETRRRIADGLHPLGRGRPVGPTAG